MINSKIITTLKPLNVKIYWQEYDGDDAEYIIFSTTSQNDTFHNDDSSEVEVIDIGLVYWFKNPIQSASKIRELKQLMKLDNFIKVQEKDLRDGEYFGRSFLFRYFEGL